jgi:hypothetical protein
MRLGEIAVTSTDLDQAAVIAMIMQELVSVKGASLDVANEEVFLNGSSHAHLPAGKYTCHEPRGFFRGRVEFLSEVDIHTGQRTLLPLKIREIVCPVRTWVVDQAGISHRTG